MIFDILNYSKNEVYTPRLILKHYSGNNYRLIYGSFKKKGYELRDNILNKIKNISDSELYDHDYIERCSLSRTLSTIREIALCNDFKYFVTLTVNDINADRFCLDDVQDLMHKSFKEYSRRCKRFGIKFHYVFITESHLDGAYHFHGLISSCLPSDIYINDYGYNSSHFFDSRLGFNSFSRIQDKVKCCNYITKYITKECIRNKHNQIYFCSKGLSKASVSNLAFDDELVKYLNDNFIWADTPLDYVKVCDFDYSCLSSELQQKLFCLEDKNILSEYIDIY